MTDLEKFVQLYKDFGILCNVIVSENGQQCIYLNGDSETGTFSERLGGYNGFYSIVRFDIDGKFLFQGFFE